MLSTELRRPIIPPSSFTMADNKSPCSRLLPRLLHCYNHSHPSPLSFSAPPSPPPAACCLHTRSSVNRLFTGFDGVQRFDLLGFVLCVCVCGGVLYFFSLMLLCSAGGSGQWHYRTRKTFGYIHRQKHTNLEVPQAHEWAHV